MTIKSIIQWMLLTSGLFLTFFGFLTFIFVFLGLYQFDLFDFRLSSGVRVISELSISGCLLLAMGFGIDDYLNESTT